MPAETDQKTGLPIYSLYGDTRRPTAAMLDNLDTIVTDVTGSADLSITKSDSPDPVLAGDELTYTIDVTNSGPSTATDVRRRIPPPA